MDNDLLIREYEKIRHILRDFYIFGFFTQEEYIERKKISPSKYNKEKRKLESYLPADFLNVKSEDRKLIQYCKYNMFDVKENYMVNTFKAKTFKELDIKSYFWILKLLSEEDTKKGLSELVGEIEYSKSFDITKQNLSGKLKEMIKYGIIVRENENGNPKYCLNEDLLEDFSDEEIEDICVMLEFVKNTAPLETAFVFLQDKLELYLKCKRGISKINKDLFLYKHRHLFNVLDDEILMHLLRAINKKARIQIKLKTRRGDGIFDTIPVKIIYDMMYGRQYLLCFDEVRNLFVVNRIDKILDVKINKKIPDDRFDEILKLSEVHKKCWCTSGIASDKDTLVKIEFKFDEEKEGYILQRISRECNEGTITKVKEGVYLFEIYIRDPREMIPWIRSFGERAEVLESGTYKLEDEISNDWRALLNKYGAI